VCGTLTDRLARQGVPPVLTYFAGCAVCTVCMLPIVLGYSTNAVLFWSLFLGFSAFGSLSYPLLATRFPVAITGRVVTAVNLVTFSMAFAVQFGVGAILNLWPVVDGRYAVEGYRVAFALCWGLQVVSVVWLWYAERGAMKVGVTPDASPPSTT
jgi:hypothetical protein